MQQMPLYRAFAHTLNAIRTCEERTTDNTAALANHHDNLARLLRLMPSGSGIDCGTKLDRNRSNDDKLVFTADYHHMNDGGFYDGWTSHQITVKASLVFELDLTIGGRNRNDIKDYLHDVYRTTLMQMVDPYMPAEQQPSV